MTVFGARNASSYIDRWLCVQRGRETKTRAPRKPPGRPDAGPRARPKVTSAGHAQRSKRDSRPRPHGLPPGKPQAPPGISRQGTRDTCTPCPRPLAQERAAATELPEKASRSLRTLTKRRRCPPSLRGLRLTASHRHQEDGVPARGPLEVRRGDPDQPIELLTAQGWQPTAPGDPGPGRVCGGGRGDGRAGPSCPGRPLSRGQGLQVRLKTTPRQGL